MRGRGGHPGNFALQQKFLSVKTTFGYITSYWRGCVPAFVGHSYWELRQCTCGCFSGLEIIVCTQALVALQALFAVLTTSRNLREGENDSIAGGNMNNIFLQ